MNFKNIETADIQVDWSQKYHNFYLYSFYI